MRDAFGGTILIKIIIVFIVIYVVFMGAAVQYAKAFKLKNGIINMMEVSSFDGTTSDPVISEIETYLKDGNYSGYVNASQASCSGTFVSVDSNRGYCYEEKMVTSKSSYYKVTTYLVIDLHIFDLVIPIPIKGETKVIYKN